MKLSGATVLSWARLLRLPNLFTVPGDPIAGAVLAAAVVSQEPSGWQIASTAAAILAVYCGGLMLNDLADYRLDVKSRPERPLPRGLLTSAQVKTGLGISCTAAFVFAFLAGTGVFVTVLVLVFLVYAYDCLYKNHPVNGPLTMGLCRGFSFLAGAGLFGWPVSLLPIMAVLTAYVTSVTLIAYRENRSFQRFGRLARFPLLCFTLICISALFIMRGQGGSMWIAVIVMLAGAVFIYRQQIRLLAGVTAKETQAIIGRLLRLLIAVQAVLIFLAPGIEAGIIAAVLILAVLPAATFTGRFISSS